MCGITALLGDRHSAAGLKLLEGLRHRGPDGSGWLDLDGCFLAMARLAILDPTKRADQPMTSEGHHLVYNGELFNFRTLRRDLQRDGASFQTTGDTEVVLKALVRWGAVGACNRFRGMFAFAVWDESRRELTVARDRYGVKPLYWRALPGGGVAVASEATPLAALQANGVRVDAIREFLRFGSPISSCAFEGVVEVEPATVTTWSSDGACRTTALRGTCADGSDPPLALRSVASEMLASDRPVALFLSGGFDSAVLAAVTASSGIPPVGLTLATSGNRADVARAASTAKHYGLDHSVHHISRGDVETLVERFLAAMDQPTIDGFNTFLVSRAAVDEGFPVALSGLGGDELMGGYGYYRWQRHVDVAAAAWRRSPVVLRRGAAKVGGRILHRRPTEVAAILDARSLAERHRAWRGLFTREEVIRLTGSDAEASLRWSCNPSEPPRTQLSQLDFQAYLRPTLLRDTDVFSMANSVEVRVPLLDERFVSAVRTAPAPLTKERLALAWGDEYLFRLAREAKLTFALPWGDWIHSVLMERSLMIDGDDPWRGLIDPKEARRILSASRSGGTGETLRTWALVVLAAWLARPAHARRLPGRKA